MVLYVKSNLDGINTIERSRDVINNYTREIDNFENYPVFIDVDQPLSRRYSGWTCSE